MRRNITYSLSRLIALAISMLALAACTYNPFVANNHLTGSPVSTAVGAGIGAGSVALLGGTKPYIGAAGLIGGAVGYYVSSLRYDSGGIIQSGGKVYRVGEFIGIYIPSDRLFEPNSDQFIPDAKPILDSAANIVKRFPDNRILISGNTSGFYQANWEQRISEKRAQKVAAYFWNAGIRNGNYVGYGDYFPISKSLHNKGIRENSRIQITSYLADCDLNTRGKPMSILNLFQ